jgi:pyridoxal phosphate enzyme (YggS family)
MTSTDCNNTLDDNFETIYQRVEQACKLSNRSTNDVTLVAVTKKQPVEKIQSYLNFCLKTNRSPVIAENYVQEWETKKHNLVGDYRCHLIGHLQSNKAKLAVHLFDEVQTVDSIKLVQFLAKESLASNKKIKVWVQVNISDDQSKHGVSAENTFHLVESILSSPLEFSGLMTITKVYQQPSEARPDFYALKHLGDQLLQKFGLAKVGLSMGMSDDFQVAIECGATCVRVGSALFGARS